MLRKSEEYVSGKTLGVEEKEHKIFANKYIVDFYKKAEDVPIFYISIK